MEGIIQTKEIISGNEKDTISTFYMEPSGGIMRLNKLGETVSFPKNYIFVQQNQITEYCYVLKSGRVVSFEQTANGGERIYHFYDKDTVFLEADLFYESPVQVGYKAICDCSAVRIKRDDLIQAIYRDSELMMDIMASIANKLHTSLKQMVKMQGHSSEWKLCEYLISVAEHYKVNDENEVIIQDKISQKEIANIVGMNRITAVRIVKALKDKGYLEKRNGLFVVTDLDGVKEYQKKLSNK